MIYHFWRQFPSRDADERRRSAIARATWAQPGRVNVPVLTEHLPRFYIEEAPDGTTEPLPFVRDVFDLGTQGRPDDARMMFTTSDVAFFPGIIAKIEGFFDAGWLGEIQKFNVPETTQGTPLESEACLPTAYAGPGAWLFTAGWWRATRGAFPDMILPRAAWDYVLSFFFPLERRIPLERQTGFLWHISHRFMYHEPYMEGNRHNLRLALQFLRKRNLLHLQPRLCLSAFGMEEVTS